MVTNQFFFSLIVGIFVGGIAGYLGSLMIAKRMALVGDALGHVALPGIGLALIMNIDISLGAFLFLALGILIVWLSGLKTVLPAEALVGAVFVASLAIGFLIVPELDLLEALFGDISKISPVSAAGAVLFSLVVYFVIRKNYGNIVLASVSEDLAKVEGVKIGKQNLIFLLSIAIIVALGIKVTGSLLVGALLITPAAAMRNIGKNLKIYSLGSMFLGALSAVLGIVLYKITGFPAGPLIVLVSVVIFTISFAFRFRNR